MDWRTTTSILDDLKRTDGEAWQRLFDAFHDPLVRYGLRSGLSWPEAEDAAQETLMVVLDAHRAGRFRRERGRLHRWMFGMARRKVLAQLRRRSRDADRTATLSADGVDDAALSSRASQHQAWADALLESWLIRIRADFGRRTMEIFTRTVLQEESPEDVARDLGVTRNAVFMARHRVLKRLRRVREEAAGS